MTSYSPKHRETTKQGKTAVCPRFTSNSLLARFLSLEHGWGCPSPECPSSAQPISKPQLLGCSLAQSQHFLGEAPTLAPCQASGLQRDFFSPQGGARLILLSEGRGLLSLLTLEDPRLWASLATSSGPFQNLQFLTGLRACQPPYSGGGRKVASHWSLRDGGWKS